MSHEALGKTNKGKATNPNVWFVGVTPRRNPELVVAVLWQNGQFSYYPARIGAKIVSAYVEKQRRLANNLVTPAKPPAPTEMSAVWTVPNPAGQSGKAGQGAPDRLQSGHFLIDHGEIVAQASGAQSARAGTMVAGAPSAGAKAQVNSSTTLPGTNPRPTVRSSGAAEKPGASGTAKAVPFQNKNKAPQPAVPDPQPAIASAGPGDGKGR